MNFLNPLLVQFFPLVLLIIQVVRIGSNSGNCHENRKGNQPESDFVINKNAPNELEKDGKYSSGQCQSYREKTPDLRCCLDNEIRRRYGKNLIRSEKQDSREVSQIQIFEAIHVGRIKSIRRIPNTAYGVYKKVTRKMAISFRNILDDGNWEKIPLSFSERYV